ncbi:4-hydroxy-tetrahydrodipicolinate synthase [Phyllobacterium sp. YR531]|uniref:4-hydroxy-tetrahydrodipicolinate synthase n=1 Tax=Phyllobacterium sp. YR531 TaxID=1144343 RepID=UPI00026FB2A2|nr:4-hydroxy-tetrahydrodipicolinate synthase [Phyllobacterium sp. YR531]EJN00445.1 dihydrodipicolinate synthase [Phyllobacterium sp. YR531]
MQSSKPSLHGIWLPLITPFLNDELDETSLRRLVQHYASQPIDGLILGATTGEGLTLDHAEAERLVKVVKEEAERTGWQIPLYLGLDGSHTREVVKDVERTALWGIDGYLIACPYYTRPSQQGLYEHFVALANSASRLIMIYNIPYRTGVNMSNETMLRLAEHPNIIGVKDCCNDPAQSFDLLRYRQSGFTVLTGEDAQFFNAITQGADGGILASAHINASAFASVRHLLGEGDWKRALENWRLLVDLPRLLFAEPSPGPVKHWLWRAGLIDSPEVRLPMTAISEGLAARIDDLVFSMSKEH